MPVVTSIWRFARRLLLVFAVISLGVLASTLLAQDEPGAEPEDDGGVYTLVNEQLILLATIVAAIAALPPLIEFLIDRRKRKERIDLSLDDVAVAELQPRLAGMEPLLADIADLIDRARDPQRYANLTVGNEVLILGPNLSGKKTLAQRIAKEAKLDRLITVYNPRNADALAKAKSLVRRYRRTKLMLLLPRIDSAFEKEDEDLLSELEALIETTSEKAHVLVVGTALTLRPDSALDNAFGIKLVLPGTHQVMPSDRQTPESAARLLREVARFYYDQATAAGFHSDGLTPESLTARILEHANNPAEIEDIFALARTAALYRRNNRLAPELTITMADVDTAIARVIVGEVTVGDE